MVVEPGYPFQGGQFDGFTRFPGSAAVDEIGLVEPIDGLGQGVVVTVALAAHRRLYAGFCETLAVANGDVLPRFKRSSQHCRLRMMINDRRMLRQVFATQELCEDGY